MTNIPFCTGELPKDYDYLAPDGSEIRRPLKNKPSKDMNGGLKGGGLAHCTLPPGSVSQAVKHREVEEIWYFLSGEGEVWRKQEGREETVGVTKNTCLTIPPEVHFQFRNQGEETLQFVIATMPPWPGKKEAIPVDNYWDIDQNNDIE